MKIRLSQLRNIIAEEVKKVLNEAYVSSLPPKEKVIDPHAKKVKVIDPLEIPPASSRRRSSPPKSKNSPLLSDEEVIDTLDLYGVDRRNALDMLASDKNLRRDLKLGDPSLKNSDYYRKIYALASSKKN
jgi:hypothetical protein